ncbi:MAG: hypothetical protein GC181_13900 [Bacteroidetes bacterium]|nr:hypothetical protein [Bacteroidota bacterium]
MKYKLTVNQLLLVIALAVSGFWFAGCKPEDPSPSIVSLFYAEELEISAMHKVGDSSCPQTLPSIPIDLTIKGGDLHPDSIVVSSEHFAINAFFSSGEQSVGSVGFEDSESVKLQFNCGTQDSFEGKVKITYYKEGKVIDGESVTVKMTIEK